MINIKIPLPLTEVIFRASSSLVLCLFNFPLSKIRWYDISTSHCNYVSLNFSLNLKQILLIYACSGRDTMLFSNDSLLLYPHCKLYIWMKTNYQISLLFLLFYFDININCLDLFYFYLYNCSFFYLMIVYPWKGDAWDRLLAEYMYYVWFPIFIFSSTQRYYLGHVVLYKTEKVHYSLSSPLITNYGQKTKHN